MICGRFYAAQSASQPGDFTLVAVVPLTLHPEKFTTKTHDHRTDATLLWRPRQFTRAQFKCIHRTMFVVPCICTQCVFHGNKSNFNAGIYVIMTILNTNLGLSQISPQRMYQFDCVIFMINSFKSYLILPPSTIYPFIPLIYHLFISIYKICICFNSFLFALLY